MTKKQKKMLLRILVTAVMLAVLHVLPITGVPAACGSTLDLAVRLDLAAGLENGLHGLFLVRALGKFHDHFLRHEIDGRGGDALGRPFSVLEIPFAFSEASGADRLHFFAAVSILQL